MFTSETASLKSITATIYEWKNPERILVFQGHHADTENIMVPV